VKPLRHTVPLGAGETPASFASRTAALYGLPAREFCLDFGTTFQKVVDGEPTAIAVVAAKGGIPAASLAEHAFIRGEKHRYVHRGEQLIRGGLRRQAIAVCPRCLAEDIAVSQSRPSLAPFGRAIWQIAAVKTCAAHGIALSIVIRDLTPGKLHDFAHHVAGVVSGLDRLVAEAVERPVSGLEAYVTGRLDAHAGPQLLDRLPLYVAIGACELFGAVATLGRTPDLKRLTDEQWHAAGGAGFEIFSSGEVGVADFLEGLWKSYPYSGAATEGAQAIFGRIYQALEYGREDPSYDGVRELVGDFIRTRFPVGAGDVVFGKPVERRTLHSVRTLSAETGLHPKRLRKLLAVAGTLPTDADGLADGNCLFDAEKGSMAAREAAAATLSVRKTGEYLNAPRVQRDRLYRTGLIVPRVRGMDHGAADQFTPEDLDAFLDRLLDGAKPAKVAKAGQVNIPEAARLAFCMSEEVVRLILDGKLARKWRLRGERGYMSVLVDVDEVRSLVRGPDKGGFTGMEIKDKLSTTAKVAAALIKHGHLATITVVNPVNRCPTVVVPAVEVERFGKRYVSLFVLAKQQRRHFRAVKKDLDAAGIEPALDAKKVGATFYQWKDLTGN
jgi:TniQ